MSIERGDFEAISETDLDELVTTQVPEGLRFEYKQQLYGARDRDKHELLKDVSALANSYGGHLLLGIEEVGGSASRILGVECPDPDAEVLRMTQILRAGIEPPISGIRVKFVLLNNGRYVFAIRVPRSWHPPHRVIAQGSNRFYVRHSAGVHEASVEELRALFTQSSSILEHARRFRDERIRSVCAGEAHRPLAEHGRLFFHIFPASASTGLMNIDLESAYRLHESFRPIGTMGMSPCFNYFGFVNERAGEENYGYTQVFRNGCLEATKANLKTIEGPGIPGLAMERQIFEVLPLYINGLRDLGVQPPLILMFTLEEVAGTRYHVMNTLENEPPLVDDVLHLPEGYLENYGDTVDYHRAVRPAFDALWNAIGYSGSRFFNADGLWIGQQ